MPRVLAAIALACAFMIMSASADAEIVVTVDKTAQRLTVDVDGVHRYDWPVSTARWGYRTPNGSYRPERLARTWYSRKYDWSPMPWSIFFSGGYAIHGSYEVSHLGRPASHGCIRLHPNNARILFELVQQRVRSTRIVVIGEGPPVTYHEGAARRWHRPVRPDEQDMTFRGIFAPHGRGGYWY